MIFEKEIFFNIRNWEGYVVELGGVSTQGFTWSEAMSADDLRLEKSVF